MLRRNLELLPAGLAGDFVGGAQQVVAELCELRAIAFVRATGRSVLLDPPDPTDAVLVGAPALRALIPSLPGLWFLRKKRAFVEGHALIVAMIAENGKMVGLV